MKLTPATLLAALLACATQPGNVNADGSVDTSDDLYNKVSPLLQHALTHMALNYDPHKKKDNVRHWVDRQIELGNEAARSLLRDDHEAIGLDAAYQVTDPISHLDFGFGKLGDLLQNESDSDDGDEDFDFNDFFKVHAGEEDEGGEPVDTILNHMLGPKGWGIQDEKLLSKLSSKSGSSQSSQSSSSWSSSSSNSQGSSGSGGTESSSYFYKDRSSSSANFAKAYLKMGRQFGAR